MQLKHFAMISRLLTNLVLTQLTDRTEAQTQDNLKSPTLKTLKKSRDKPIIIDLIH